MQIRELKCFGEHAGDGNPALVIEGDGRDEAGRQAFARERNTTCVFLDPAGEADVTCRLDYFYPHARSPLCLHATLAAAWVLFERHGPAPLTAATAMRGQRLGLSRIGGELFVRLARQGAPDLDIEPALVPRLLDAPGIALASRPVVGSVGSPKLLVEVPDRATLRALAPDLGLITAWGKEHGVNGCYVYCRTAEGEYEGRNFNHLDPTLEDSATGVAAGALSAVLGRGITLRQGHATGRACLIRTLVEGADILVGGLAEPA